MASAFWELILKTRVLVVDDDPFIRMDIAAMVEDAGFEVYEAEDADQAVSVLERDTTIRLLVTDIDMPGSMDGLKLARLTRDRWPPVKIIVISGRVKPEVAELPDDAQFLTKPVSPHRLEAALAQA